MVDAYLLAVYEEAEKRGFHFDREKIGPRFSDQRIPVTDGQLRYEFHHLLQKLSQRDPRKFEQISVVTVPEPHPLFLMVSGGVEPWERISSND